MSNKSSDFWYYSRNERRATIVLFLVVIILFLLPAIFRFLPGDQPQADTQLFQEAIYILESAKKDSTDLYAVADLFYFDPNTIDAEALQALGLPPSTVGTILNYRQKGGKFKQASDLSKIYNLHSSDFERLRPYVRIGTLASESQKQPKSAPEAITLFSFDPNTILEKDLLQLGLPVQVVRNVIRYREKGGQFRRTEDLKKIYGLRPTDFERLQPYIQIQEAETATPPDFAAISEKGQEGSAVLPASYEAAAPASIDINLASAEEWQQLYGLGPVLSSRIVKFREKLGGFIHIDQVAETFGLPDSTFQAIRPKLQVSPLIEFIPINTADAERLKAHPYIKWQQANVIVAYRKEHGPFTNLEDLRKVRALNEDFITKVGPYLQFKAMDNY